MTQVIDGRLFAEMVNAGAVNLRVHAKEINDLNVFPIPDGDTGDNMLLTMLGGIQPGETVGKCLCEVAEKVANGMLLSARGNSGVILSQFFEGIKNGLAGLDTADADAIGLAFRHGVAQAYRAVMTPTEGTILTVAREATEYACTQHAETPEAFLNAFISQAGVSLSRTPEMLPVLKKAGVVDSGAAGLICITDGMMQVLKGETLNDTFSFEEKTQEMDIDAFDEDSVLEFGYCTELLLRLQNAKTDLTAFDGRVITDYLQTVGDSVVAVRNGSIIKIHVHTMTPDRVLGFCRLYGEFLKVKIENMSLQHNNMVTVTCDAAGPGTGTAITNAQQSPRKDRKRFGVVAVASGRGLKQTFIDRGADVIVDGGQSMNPSVGAFMAAFDEVNADTIFVFPNNGNIILTAKQAAGLYTKSDVRVIESTTVGGGYASLAMLDTGTGDVDAIVAALTEAMQGVVTVEISRCVRDANMEHTEMHVGDYIGFVGKQLLCVHKDPLTVLCESLDRIHFEQYDICILICGKEAINEEAEQVKRYIRARYAGKEVYVINGDQEVYDYIMIVE